MTFILYNFNLIESSDFQLDIENRGFLFGDGFFETMIYNNGSINFINDHYVRINDALKAYKGYFKEDFKLDLFIKKILELVKSQNHIGPTKIKFIAYRVSDGGYSPLDHLFNSVAFCKPYQVGTGIKSNAIVYEEMKVQKSPISKFKNLSADVYVQAGIFMRERNCDEVIILGPHKVVAECLYSNLYWVKDNTVFTPSLDSGCVAGISRKNILEKIQKSSYNLEEGLFSIDHLLKADCIFNSNVGGISTIEIINGNDYDPIPEKLRLVLN